MKRYLTVLGLLAGVAALTLTLGLFMLGDSGLNPGATQVLADNEQECTYELTARDGAPGRFVVEVEENELKMEVSDADPNTLYTVWFNFLPGRPADSQGVAPAFATIAGVFEGMRMDINGFITDSDGDAEFEAELDYNLLQPDDAPVVFKDNTSDPLRDLDKQGKNRVGGHWKRVYLSDDYNAAASLQSTNPDGRPLVERGTAKGIVMAQHFDFVTHGHTPGVGGVDFFVPFSGAFPPECMAHDDDDD